MASVSCESIYSMFLGYIKDYELLAKSQAIVEELMAEWLKKSYSRPYVRRLFSSIEPGDDYETGEEGLVFTLKHEGDESADKDFVTDILALGMVAAWLAPVLRDKTNLAQFFGGKEQKFYSQSNHIEQLRAVYEEAVREQRNLIRDRGFISNSYLGGTT